MKSIKQIASLVGCSKSAVFQHIRQLKRRGIDLHKFAQRYHNTLYFNATGVYLITLSFRAKNSKATTVKSLKAKINKLHAKLKLSKNKTAKINDKLNRILRLEKHINNQLMKRPNPKRHGIRALLRRTFK